MKPIPTTKVTLPDETLRDSEARYRWLFESTAIDGIIILDAKTGQVVEVNPFLTKLLGFSREQVIKKKIWELGYFKDILASKKNFKDLLQKGFVRYDGLPLKTADGLQIDVEFVGYVYEAGNQKMIQCSIRDITERKKTEEALAQEQSLLHALMDNIPDQVFFKDAASRFIRISKAQAKRFGLSDPAQAVGKTDFDFFTKDHAQPAFEDEQKIMRTGQPLVDLEEKETWPDSRTTWVSTTKMPLCDGQGQIVGTFGISRDITERKREEEAQRENEERFRSLYENATIGLYRTSPDGRIFLANPAMVRMLGYSSFEELSTRNLEISGFEPSYSRRQFIKNIENDGEVRGIESAWTQKDGTIIFVRESARAIRDSEANILYYDGTVEDITERKRAEEGLRESLERFQLANRATFDAIWDWNLQTDALWRNENLLPLFGYRDGEIESDIESWANLIHPEDRDRVMTSIHAAIASGQEYWFDQYRFRREDGMYAEVEDRGHIARDASGRPTRMIGAVRDITERIRSEKAIQASLQEKEVMLREIHHRVKNNMQVISSLFNLQAGKTVNPEYREILKEGQARIQAMSLVHEKLYQSRDLSKIDLAGYIQSLAIHLFHVYLADPDQVRLETDFEEVLLDINSAVPCGLILNELISNSLKHAFPEGRKGLIRIGLKRGSDGTIILRVADDGIGFPKDLDFRQLESLGLQIAKLLVGQIEGMIELDRTNGTAFTVTFREIKYAPRN
jgi:PAS domain S-box-containing protein